MAADALSPLFFCEYLNSRPHSVLSSTRRASRRIQKYVGLRRGAGLRAYAVAIITGMNPPPYTTDTSADASAVQLDCLRRMTPQQRLQKTVAISSQVRKMAFDAIRRRHPELSDDQVQLRFIQLAYGDELATDFARWTSEKHVE
jgi:hypothetical protein